MSGPHMTALEVIGGLGLTGAGAAILRLAQLYVEKRGSASSPSKDAADIVTAAASFQDALNTAAKGVIGDLLANQTRLEAEIENLKAENARCHAEAQALRQAQRQQEQRIESLLRQLRDPASTAPGGSLAGALIEMSGGDVTVTRPTRTRKPK